MMPRLLLLITHVFLILGEFFIVSSTTELQPSSTLVQRSTEIPLGGEGIGDSDCEKRTGNSTSGDCTTNMNKHAPIFIMPAFNNATIEVPENVGVADYLVMTVRAVDEDHQANGRISYHIKQGNKNVQKTNEFAINVDTGDLRTKIMLDGEKRRNYSLVLVASDNGQPVPKETLQFLTVMLVDTDENKPEFPRNTSVYHFQLTENSPKGVLVGKVEVVKQSKRKPLPVYYYIVAGNSYGGFYINRTHGSIFTKTSFDRELRDEYDMLIKASTEPDYVSSQEDPERFEGEYDPSVARVKVTILDENDNLPHFEQANYYAGVNAMASIGEFVAKVKAHDPDLSINGSIVYHIAAAKLIKSGLEHFPYYVSPSPFKVAEDGRITTTNYMAEYNQQRIELEVAARELAPPGRQTRTKVHVWVYQPRQLIRMILSRSPEEVEEERNEIAFELSNITESVIVIDDVRYHVDSTGQIRREWCDVYLHVVDGLTHSIMPIPEVLRLMDAKYYNLKDYYISIGVEDVTPAFIAIQEDTFNIILAALIAMVTVVLIGCVTLIALCCCHSHRLASSSSSLRRKEALIKQDILDDLNDTTESPFWIEEKCTDEDPVMQVYCVPDGSQNQLMEHPSSQDPILVENSGTQMLYSSQPKWTDSCDYGERTCDLLRNTQSEVCG